MLATPNSLDRPPLPPGCGFRVCALCNGMGFLRIGTLAGEHSYRRCGACQGLGIIYNEPEP